MPILTNEIFLSIIHGLTEFLPVSNSAHLILLERVFEFKMNPDVEWAANWAALSVILIYFRRDLAAMIRQTFIFMGKYPASENRAELADEYPHALLTGFILLATISTAALGFIFKDFFKTGFNSLSVISIAWMVMGLVLIFSKKLAGHPRPLDLMSHRDAFIIGVAQGISFIPGLSRPGATLFAGQACEIEIKDAARFSFLIAIPVILWKMFILKDDIDFSQLDLISFAAAFSAAFIAGYLALTILMFTIQNKKFHWFGYYSLAMGTILLGYSLLS